MRANDACDYASFVAGPLDRLGARVKPSPDRELALLEELRFDTVVSHNSIERW